MYVCVSIHEPGVASTDLCMCVCVTKRHTQLREIWIGRCTGAYIADLQQAISFMKATRPFDNNREEEEEYSVYKVGKPQKCFPITFPYVTLSFVTDLDLDIHSV